MRCESSSLRHQTRSLTQVRPRQRFRRASRVRRCHASASAEQPLNSAARKLEFNDRIGALREWEKALKSRALSKEARKVLLYNCAAVHANMGDLELAQAPLREALNLGLDFEKCVDAPEPGMIPWKSSQQVIIGLRRFAQKYRAQETVESRLRKPATGVILTPQGIRAAMTEQDVGDILGTDITGMDKSLAGIAKRVILLVAVLAGSGALLFWLGLIFLYPDL